MPQIPWLDQDEYEYETDSEEYYDYSSEEGERINISAVKFNIFTCMYTYIHYGLVIDMCMYVYSYNVLVISDIYSFHFIDVEWDDTEEEWDAYEAYSDQVTEFWEPRKISHNEHNSKHSYKILTLLF